MNPSRRALVVVLLVLGVATPAHAQWWCDLFGLACPAPRQTVFLEIDRMAGTAPLQLEQTIGGQVVTLDSIYDGAGVDVIAHVDETDVPREESLSLADLHALLTNHQSVAAPAGTWKAYALIATEDAEKPRNLGLMFDFDFGEDHANDAPREAFALFEKPHHDLAGNLEPEMLLTAAHELAHVFNLHHQDWEGTNFRQGATVESYSFADTVKWRLSDRSIDHLKNHLRELVAPGGSNLQFNTVTAAHHASHQSSPGGSFTVFDASVVDDVSRAPGAAAARSKLAYDSARIVASDDVGLRLHLRPPKPNYATFEPVVVELELENTSAEPVEPLGPLDPEFGVLSISIRAPGDTAFRPFRPAILRDGRGQRMDPLEPGASRLVGAKVFLGADGWNFDEPGEWKLRADYPIDTTGRRISSGEVSVHVTATPPDDASRAGGMMQSETREPGLFLLLGGGNHLTLGKQRMEQIVAQAPDSPHADAARLALAQEALNPTINPVSRVKPPPRLDEAQAYLDAVKRGSVSRVQVLATQDALSRAYQRAGREQDALRLDDSIRTDYPELIEKLPRSLDLERRTLERRP